MTHQLSGFMVKALMDEHGGRWYLFFRVNVTDPFLVLRESDMEALVGVVKLEKEESPGD